MKYWAILRSIVQFKRKIMKAQSPGFDCNNFFSINDEELLSLIQKEYPEELERLTRAYSIRSPDTTSISPEKSPSRILFGEEFDEVNRTLVGVLALRWLYHGQYQKFVLNQPEAVKLTRESFDWMRNLFTTGIKTPQDLYALVMSMVVNDLGKDPQLSSDYHSRTTEDISGLNHDMVLLKAVNAGLVPCLDRLSPAYKANIVKGMELGAEFNFGQLAQAENAPACLSGLLDMRKYPRAFELRFMEQLLDISGAAGHMDWTCAKKLIQPIFDAYRTVHDAASGIISGKYGLREGYDTILIRRTTLLQEKGFRRVNISSPPDRALARLLCMGGVADLHTALLYDSAWKALDSTVQEGLNYSLNVDGSVDEPAVQPTYMPALLTQGLLAVKTKSEDVQERTLQIMFHYLARIMEITERPKPTVTVVERNVLHIVKDVISSDDFKADPSILLNVKVPKDEVAKSV